MFGHRYYGQRYAGSRFFGPASGASPSSTIYEVVPFLIGDTQDAAVARIESIYCSALVTGSTGTVTSQTPLAFTQILRGATIAISLGGPTNSPQSQRRYGLAPYNSGVA